MILPLFGPRFHLAALLLLALPLKAQVLQDRNFSSFSNKDWICLAGTSLSVQDEPLLKGKSLLVSNSKIYGGLILPFPEVNLAPGERLRLDFDLLFRTVPASQQAGFRYGFLHSGADGSAALRSRVNDKGYGVSVGLGTNRMFMLNQDLGSSASAFTGSDNSFDHLKGASDVVQTQKGGDKSGQKFGGLAAGKVEPVSLDITRTATGILLETQIGQSFNNSQDRLDFQTQFNGVSLLVGDAPMDFLIANLKVQKFPAPPPSSSSAPAAVSPAAPKEKP